MRGFFGMLWLLLVAAGLWMLAQWLQLPLIPNADAAIGVITLVWLFFLVTVPWNMYFQAQQILYDAQISRSRGIAVDETALAYAARWARIALWIAIGLHVVTALALCLMAISGIGFIGWFGAGAAILLTLLRPGLRAYAHIRNRLSQIGNELAVPREDAFELRRRLAQTEDHVRELMVQLDSTHEGSLAQQTLQRLHALEQRATEAADRHNDFAEHMRLELIRVERDAKNTVAQVLGDAAVVGHVRELVRFFKQA